MTYVDKTKYAGDFVLGRRDGYGKLLDAEGKDIPGQGGVFIKNRLEPYGVVVDVTVLDPNDTPVQYGKVALGPFGAVRTHVDRIGTIMEWDEKLQLRLVVVGDGARDGHRVAKVKVVGRMIDPSEDPNVANSSWPLDGAGPFKVTAHTL